MADYSCKISPAGKKLWYLGGKRIAKKNVPDQYRDDGNGACSKLPPPKKDRVSTVACRKVDPTMYAQKNYRPLVNNRGKVVSGIRIVENEPYRVSQQLHEYAHVQSDYRLSLIIWRDPWFVIPIEGAIQTATPDLVKGYDIIDVPKQHLYVLSKMRSLNLDTELEKWTSETQPRVYKKGKEFICFNMVRYISHLWGKPYHASITPIYLTWEALSLLRGVFHCEINNSVESHGFIIWITDKWLHLYEGYGGYFEGIYLKLPRDNWFEMNTKLSKFRCKEQKEMLLALFDFPREIFEENYLCAEYEPIIFGKYVEVMRIA